MKKYLKIFIPALSLGAFISCSSEMDTAGDLENGLEQKGKTCELIMNVERTGFDDEEATRGAAAWENGDVVYLIFDSSKSIYGDAVYNNGKWLLTYYGTISEGSSSTCQAVYVENPTGEIGSALNMDLHSCIYEDAAASYVMEGGSITMSATLSPKTGRIRFEGTSNQAFKLYGISVYTAFNTTTGNFTLQQGMINETVQGSYSPYVYGVFTSEEEPRINIIYSESAFTRQLSTNIFRAGESGYLTLPTTASHPGWRNHAVFKLNGVEFAMIPVEYSEGNFLMAETETTEALYYAVMATGNSSQLPKYDITGDYWEKFVVNLNQMMKLDFRFPTEEEWQYAFIGGNRSQGYTYSGSDDIYEVAWFDGNSGGKRHDVKLLQPNELGFYDMSGNIWELVGPPYGYSYQFYGGYYNSNAFYCNGKNYQNGSTYNANLRLTLSND